MMLATSILIGGCSSSGGSGGFDPFAATLHAAYNLLVEEQGDSFVAQYPDPLAYEDFGWELYREAGFGTLSWSGGVDGHELERTVDRHGFVWYRTKSNLTGRVRVTINGVDGQNTRVQFSEVTEQGGGTAHNIPDLVFSLLPHLEAGHTVLSYAETSGNDPAYAGIEITPELRGPLTGRILSYPGGEVEGIFWRHADRYSGTFRATREGLQE